ncbi:VirB8/TrbF family protein [Sphingomonas sp. TDK1]|uniref:VirB8/TrbF family protein n=1 Tax=Sphingomonas sp. TDK1 TaxID=453247 RepID=UPI000A010AA6
MTAACSADPRLLGRVQSLYVRAADPFARIGQRTVSVQVTSVVRASDRSFQVKWTETAYERGNAAGTSHWTGILTILTKPPVSADTLRKNPLGIYIDAIDWSRELEPAAPAASTRTAQPPSNVPLGSPLDPNLGAQPTVNTETQP